MTKLDELKAKLSSLEAGQTVRVHELEMAEALAGERHTMHAYPGVDLQFQWWCQDSGVRISHLGTSDCFEFEKVPVLAHA